jgi:hypothetical protein
VGSLVVGGGHSEKSGGRGSATLAALESRLLLIESRVEKIRGAEFNRRPLPVLVNAGDVRRDGLADLDRLTTRAEQAADDELLKLLGLIPARASLRAIESSVFGDQVAGFYDPATKRLALVRNTGAQNEAVGEITLAHELTHALDDQHFGIRDQAPTADDRGLAYSALVEGDATAVMTRYATQYMAGMNLLEVLFASSSAEGTAPLPPYIQASLEFPYLDGERFIEALVRYARGWKLVNYAFRFRPPVSTAQILHPLEYVHNVRPRPPRLRVRPLLGRGWRRTLSGALGEFDTRQLLQRGSPAPHADQVAAAWRGGSYELWRSAPLGSPACQRPCRAVDSLLLAWRTDAGRDAHALAQGVGAYVAKGLGASARGGNVWTLPAGGAAAVATRTGTTVLALAPTTAMARLLASGASASAG